VTLGAGVVNNGFFSWSIIGPLLLVFIFLGSSNLQESISAKKYPEYSNYVNKVSKYIPFIRYRKG
jgi:steroid 5-alpha reductase family enzyme